MCQVLFTGGRKYSKELVYKLCIMTPDVFRGLDLQELYDKNELDDYLFGSNNEANSVSL